MMDGTDAPAPRRDRPDGDPPPSPQRGAGRGGVGRWLRRVLLLLAVLVLAAIAGAAAGIAWLQSDGGRRWLTATVSGAVSGPDLTLTLGTLSGPLPFAPVLSAVRVADRDGVWLTVEDARLTIDPWALLDRRVVVRAVGAARVTVERPPKPSAAPADPTPPVAATPPTLPHLPVELAVERLTVGELRLGPALLGQAAVLSVDGSARLAANGGGLTAALSVTRTDGPAAAAALTLNAVPAPVPAEAGWPRVDLRLTASEPAGGLAARALNLPGLPPVEVALDAGGTPAGWTARLSATGGTAAHVTLDAAGAFGPSGLDATLKLQGDAAGLLPPAVAALVGPAPVLSATLHATTDGMLTVAPLTLSVAAGSLSVDGRAADGGRTVDGTVRLALDDLSRFAALAGQPLAGAAMVEGPVGLRDGVARADLGGRVTGLRTGTPADALLGEEVRLALKAAAGMDGTIRLEDLRIDAAGAVLSGRAALAAGRVRGGATLTLPRLDPLGETLGTPVQGGAVLELSAEGPADGPELRGRVTGRGLVVDGRRLGDAELTATAAGLPASPRGTVEVRAQLAGTGLTLGGGYALAGTRLTLSDVALAVGANRVTGALAVALDTLTASGRLEGALPALGGLAELAGVGLDGSAGFTLMLDGAGGRQAATLAADARGLRVDGASGPLLAAQSLSVSGSVTDALGAAAGRARVEMQGGTLAGTPVTGLTVTADGSVTAARIEVSGSGGGGREPGTLDLAATVGRDGGAHRIRLERFQARAAGETLRLTQPATVALGEDRVEVGGLRLTAGGARLSADAALAGGRLKGTVRADEVPLALARLADPALALDGVATLSAELSGTLRAPSADVALRVAGLRAAATRQARMPGLDIDLSARWRGERLTASGAVALPGGGGRLTLAAALPLVMDPRTQIPAVPPRGALEASATGTLPLALANDLLAAAGDRAAGTLALDVRVGGTVAAPQLGGTATIADGRYENRASGAVITGITARLAGTGDVFTVQSFTGRTAGGGTLSVEGVVRPAPHEPRQIDLRVRAQGARLMETDLLSARIGANLTLAGTFARSLLAGTVTIEEAEVQIPDRLPPNVVDLKVVEVGRGRPAPVAAKPPSVKPATTKPAAAKPPRKPGPRGAAPPAPAEAAPAAAAGPEIALDLKVVADNRVFVRGRGLSAEFGGQLAVGGTAAAPAVSGRFSMLKGTLDLLAKTFTFKRGVIDFDGAGPADPRLDLLAEATANQVTAQVQISGSARRPKLELTSPQGLPQDEVLARVLFGKSVGSLGAVEAVQLAQSAATLAGFGGGGGLLDTVRKRLGIDRLEFSGAEGGKGGSVQAGRYVSENVYVGVEQGVGAGNAQSRAKVEVDITKNIKAEAGVGAASDTRLGLKFEWEY